MRRSVVLLVGLGAVAAACVAGTAVFLFAGGPGAEDAAGHFLATLAARGPQAAYDEASGAFRDGSTEAAFAQAAARLRLGSFRRANWTGRRVNGDAAEVDGTLALGEGWTVPAAVDLTREQGVWRVAALRVQGGAETGDAVPSDAVCHQLAQVAVMRMVDAIYAKDFSALQAAGSADFRAQFSADALAAQFKPLTDRNLDLTQAESTPVVLTGKPAIDADGVLTLSGYLPASGQNWRFSVGYVREAGEWRLQSLSLSPRAG